MKRLAAVAVFAILCVAFFTQAADEPSGFAGSWILNKEKSDAMPRPVVSLGAAPGSRGGGFGGGMGGGMGRGMGRGGGMGGMGKGAEPQQEAKAYPLVIEQTGDQVKITTTMSMGGKEFPMVDTFQCDGKEHEAMVPNMMAGFGGPPGQQGQQAKQPTQVKQVTKATLKKNKLEIERKTYYQENTPRKEKRSYSVSKDGNVLTQKTTIETLMAFPGMVASNNITVQDQVYNREGSESGQKK